MHVVHVWILCKPHPHLTYDTRLYTTHMQSYTRCTMRNAQIHPKQMNRTDRLPVICINEKSHLLEKQITPGRNSIYPRVTFTVHWMGFVWVVMYIVHIHEKCDVLTSWYIAIGDLHKENEGACIDWILTHIWHLLFNHHLVVHLLLLIVLRLHIGLWLILKKVLFRRDARFSSQNSMGYYTLSLYPHFVTHVNPFYYIFGCVCVSVSSVCYRLLQNCLGGRPRKVAMQCKQFTQYLSLR